MTTAQAPVCLVDGHVHMHAAFDLETFLEGARGNFERAASDLAVEYTAGVLLLAEGSGEGAFTTLSAVAAAGKWTARSGAEMESVILECRGARPLVIIAGHQLVSAEGVEVLAHAVRDRPPDGQRMGDLLQLVRQHGAVPVLPWGFGKWAGRRGDLVASVLRSNTGVFLGDNAGRLATPRPALLAEAMSRSVPVLPGSDPLPFRDQQRRAGSSGFVVPLALHHDFPARDLRAWLNNLHQQPKTWASFTRPAQFLWNQARMQWRKRVTHPVSAASPRQ